MKYVCSVCGQNCKTITLLEKHNYAMHVGMKNYECDFCRKLFSSKGNLQNHLEIHHLGKKVECTYCMKLFSAKTLEDHIKEVHLQTRLNKCNFCQKLYRYRSGLNAHLRSESHLKIPCKTKEQR